MKTRNKIILIGIIVIVPFIIYALMPMMSVFYWSSINPRNDSFEEFLEQKATVTFDLKLKEYEIPSEKLTVKRGIGVMENVFFMAQSITNNGTRYFLMTSFNPHAFLDKIDVEIFKIISEKCTPEHIVNSIGCDPKYLEKVEKPNTAWLCADNEIYDHGICMTPETKERTESIGEIENEN